MRARSRREFLSTAAGSFAGLGLAGAFGSHGLETALAQLPGTRPARPAGVQVVNPCTRTPVSFIIDDSTVLVNLAHFCIPQFNEVFPDRYPQDWQRLPREIPDAFVRKFGTWCREHGVKGKYSIVPNPACVGWVDRDLPGWSRRDLQESLRLVREFMMPDWDIHPEMVTHTWVINTRTGRPYPERSERFMENWRWTDGKSVDELADYLSYALNILKNAGLTCEGVTTPGGFGNRVLPELSQATLQACRDVYQTEIPHYFRHLYTDERSVAPRVEYAANLDGPDPRCVVSIIGCTGDWFGGWDGLTPGTVDQFITEDGRSGRLPQVLARREPAILVCHWPGIYYNGEEIGFRIFQEVVQRLHAHHDNLLWMKLSEISRYWAARELTQLTLGSGRLQLRAPFASPRFTLEFASPLQGAPALIQGNQRTRLEEVASPLQLVAGKFQRTQTAWTACFDLPKGNSELVWGT